MFWGAICGEIIGSPYEFGTIEFDPKAPLVIDPSRCCYTDESVILASICDSILNDIPTEEALLKWYNNGFQHVSWGSRYEQWLLDQGGESYQSFGNGCLARSLPYVFSGNELFANIEAAQKAVAVTHDHPESLKAVECFMTIVFMAKGGASKDFLKKVASKFYDLESEWVQPDRSRLESAEICLTAALRAFFAGDDFEEIIEKSMLLCGDTDSVACVAGAICEAYGLQPSVELKLAAMDLLPQEIIDVTTAFEERYRHRGEILPATTNPV
jgi:ADP-ribosylglycohydrolase